MMVDTTCHGFLGPGQQIACLCQYTKAQDTARARDPSEKAGPGMEVAVDGHEYGLCWPNTLDHGHGIHDSRASPHSAGETSAHVHHGAGCRH